MTGIELIAAERQRQIEVEGWTPEHDDEHGFGGLAKAAACYAVYHTDARVIEDGEDAWPWSEKWDKRKDANDIRNLVKAGALIAAEIDRIQRRDGRKILNGEVDPRAEEKLMKLNLSKEWLERQAEREERVEAMNDKKHPNEYERGKAAGGNYTADDDTFPTEVYFANGRKVGIAFDGDKPYLTVSLLTEPR